MDTQHDTQSVKQKKETKVKLKWKEIKKKFNKKERKKKQSNYAFDGHSQHIITYIYDNTKKFCVCVFVLCSNFILSFDSVFFGF